VLAVSEGDAGRDAIGAEPGLQPSRIAQFADGDMDNAAGLPDYRPGRQPDAGLVAGRMTGWQQRGHGNCRSGRQCQHSGHGGDQAAAYAPPAGSGDYLVGRDARVRLLEGIPHPGETVFDRGQGVVVVHCVSS
jgi:hypothetical protein